MVTMGDLYAGEGDEHEACEKCGFCKDCGDCLKYGCGAEFAL